MVDRQGWAPLVLIANIIISLIAIAAIGELLTHYWGWPEWVTYPIAAVAMVMTRGILAPLAVWGAAVAWEWNWLLGAVLFMWPLIISLFFSAAAFGLSTFQKLQGPPDNSNP